MLEATLLLPLMVAFFAAAIFVVEAMVFRQDLAAATRTATVRSSAQLTCVGPGVALEARNLSTRSARVTCQSVNDEAGLRSQRPFFSAMEQQYRSTWSGFWRDIDPRAPVPAHIGTGSGDVQVSGLQWAAQAFGTNATQGDHRRADARVWRHTTDSWRRAMDPEIWRRLSQRGTANLFPNVFPGR